MKLKPRSLGCTVLVLALTLGIGVGCHRKVVITDVPTGTSTVAVTNWYAAVGIYKEMGTYTKQLTDAAIQLKPQFPSKDAYDTVLTGIGKADQLGIQGGVYLQSVPNTWNSTTQQKITDYSTQITNQLNMAISDGLAGVKDSAEKQALLAALATVNTAMKTAIALNTGGK